MLQWFAFRSEKLKGKLSASAADSKKPVLHCGRLNALANGANRYIAHQDTINGDEMACNVSMDAPFHVCQNTIKLLLARLKI